MEKEASRLISPASKPNMLKTVFVIVATVFLTGMVTSAASSTGSDSGRVTVNNLSYYYEIHGEGEPLLLLHGGLGSIDMFGPVLALLAENRKVIGVDLHGHGRTALGDRPISYVDMGDDMAALLKKQGYDQVDVMGYSMGGGVALRLAIQHPGSVRRLVVASAGFTSVSILVK